MCRDDLREDVCADMKQNVHLKIKSTIKTENHTDNYELFTEGIFYKSEDAYYVVYDDIDTEMDQHYETTLKIQKNNKIDIMRSGVVQYHINLIKNKRTLGNLTTNLGNIQIGVNCKVLESYITSEGGFLSLMYVIDINASATSENTIEMEIEKIPGGVYGQLD